MNTLYFMLVLMTVKGTKCGFTLVWLKNVSKNEKFHNTFYLFIFQTALLESTKAMQRNLLILFSKIHADLHVVELLL